jgi:MFS family permease
MNVSIPRDLLLINAAAFPRSFSVGLTGVVLGIYLSRVGLSSVDIGLVIGAGSTGAALATVVVTVRGDYIGRSRTLVVLSVLSAIGGIALGLAPRITILLPLALVGMVNGMGTGRSNGSL